MISPSVQSNTTEQAPTTLRRFLLVAYMIIAVLPGYVFFAARGGIGFMRGLGAANTSLALFPLLGLYAFFLIWAQIMIGSNIRFLRRVYPRIDRFHRFEGLFVLLFAVLHPTLLIVGVGLEKYLSKAFVLPGQELFVWLGQVQLLVLIVTVGAALGMRLPWLQRRWKYIHYLNYAVFISAWIHSWFLGSDTRARPLKYLWWFFAATFIVAVGRRIFEARTRPATPSAPNRRFQVSGGQSPSQNHT